MRYFIATVGVLASLILLASSASMNYLFMYSLGKTELESHVLSAASVGADVLKASLPFFSLLGLSEWPLCVQCGEPGVVRLLYWAFVAIGVELHSGLAPGGFRS